MAHDVHDFIQFYDVNLHSQQPDSPDLNTCGCSQDQLCSWQNFFNLVISTPTSAGTPYPADLFTLQEVGNHRSHVHCDQIVSYLNSLTAQAGATWKLPMH